MKKLILTLPFIFSAFSGHGQNSEQFTGSLLWKISGNGLEHPSYIFGTHHLVDVSFAQNYPGFAEALEGAAQVIGEIDMAEMASAQTAMMSAAVLPAGTTYETLLSADELQLLDSLLKGYLGAGLDRYGQFRPAIVNQIMVMKQIAEAMPELNLKAHISIDQYVQDTAKEKGKKTGGLETAADQIQAMLYADPLEIQAKSLLCALSSMEKTRDGIREMIEVYEQGDLFRAYEMGFEDPESPCPLSKEWAFALNENRNNKWVEQLPGIFADAPTFVAVGMLHLCGQEGLLYQLDQLGYTVEPVK